MLLTVCAANGRAVTCGFFEKTSRLSKRNERACFIIAINAHLVDPLHKHHHMASSLRQPLP